jgi:serine/threonine-protein kinase
VEAAALLGAPVYFSRVEPWTKPGRSADSSSSTQEVITFSVLGTVLVVVCFAAGVLAHRNFKQQRGDRRGAFRLAVFFSCVQLALWLARGHFTVSFGTFGVFILAMCTAIFYGVIIWTVYIALEPYVRRRWPHTMISWSAVLIGRMRDAVVGRDALIGCAAGAAIQLVACMADTWVRLRGRWVPNLEAPAFLDGMHPTLGWVLTAVPHAIREALFFFFLIFLLRVLLRNQWVAAAVFAAIFVLPNTASANQPWVGAALSFVIIFGIAALVLRLGVLTAATAILFTNLVNGPPIGQASAWYAGSTVFMLGAAFALTLWAFKTSLGSRTLWDPDLFG